MFSVLLEGGFLLQGFRNKDIRHRLFPRATRDPHERKKASGRVTRWLRLLRAHGLIRKVTGTFYYRVTKRGHEVITTAQKLRNMTLLAAAT